MCILLKSRSDSARAALPLTVLEANLYFLAAIYCGRWIGHFLTLVRWGPPLGRVVITQIIIFGLLPVLFVLRLPRPDWVQVFRLRAVTWLTAAKCLLLAVVGFVFAQGIAAVVISGLWRLGLQPVNPYEQLLVDQPPLWILFLVMAVAPALLEEWAFRGLVLSGMQSLGDRAWIWAGLIFALAHGSLVRLPGLLALGLIFAYAAQRTGSLLPGLIMHLANNSIALALAFLVRQWLPMSVPVAQPAPSFAAMFVWLAAVLMTLPVILILLRSLPAAAADPKPALSPATAEPELEAIGATPEFRAPAARARWFDWLPIFIALIFLAELATNELLRMMKG